MPKKVTHEGKQPQHFSELLQFHARGSKHEPGLAQERQSQCQALNWITYKS